MDHQISRRSFMVIGAAVGASLVLPTLEACSETEDTGENGLNNGEASLSINNAKWSYDSDNDVYWQIGIEYCSAPVTTEYESLGMYVPGAYMLATENGDGTYTCEIDEKASVNGYSPYTAPIVMPINTAGYSAQPAPSSYSFSGLSSYLDAGFVYVYAGCRGRDNKYNEDGTLAYSGGAPWGVTDLKAAIRYLRYNKDFLPGNTDSIFTFGHSGGGAQSSLVGATGDSELYFKYLESIGAPLYDDSGAYISDAICGAMCWCPITALDSANGAYEWMMGQYTTTGTRSSNVWTKAFSDNLSESFADYINRAEFIDESGTILSLEATDTGIYTSGTYYEYLKQQIEKSLNNFLSDTNFPYTPENDMSMANGGFAGGGGDMPSGEITEGEMPSGNRPSSDQMPDDNSAENTFEKGRSGSDSNDDLNQENGETVIYQTVQDYIDSLNAEEEWIVYDSPSNTAQITDIKAFVVHCKNASKDVGAFDDLERSQAENKVFGDSENNALHFDAIMAELLERNSVEYSQYSDWDSSLVDAYQEYLESFDELGTESIVRQDMYNPMYYLSGYYDGYGASSVAPHWRIHSGIEQGDTSLTVETNLALALQQVKEVEDVEFEMVWEQGHTTAERTGDSTENFIAWVEACTLA